MGGDEPPDTADDARPVTSAGAGLGARLLTVARVLLPFLLLGLLARRLGTQAFRPALEVVSPLPLLAALVLGGVAVAAQSARWRVVLGGSGLPLGRREALVECYRSSALNSVLPGGVAGDVLRAWRQRTGAPKGWQPGAVSVAAERIAGLCVLLVAVSAVLVAESQPVYAAAAATLAVVAWMATRRPMSRLSRREQAAVWTWSVVALLALLALTVVVALAVGADAGPGVVATMGLVLLAGMAIPLSLGGWGPREAAGALAAVLVGAPPAVGVAVAAGYGLLATVSVLPGFLTLVIPGLAAARPERVVTAGRGDGDRVAVADGSDEGRGPYAVRNRSRNRSIRHTAPSGRAAGRSASPSPAMRSHHGRVLGDDEIGTSWPAWAPVT